MAVVVVQLVKATKTICQLGIYGACRVVLALVYFYKPIVGIENEPKSRKLWNVAKRKDLSNGLYMKRRFAGVLDYISDTIGRNSS